MRYFRYFFTAALMVAAFFVISSEFRGVYYDIPLLFKTANKPLLIFLVIFQGLNYLGGGWLSQTLLGISGFKVRLRDAFRIAILQVSGTHIAPFFGELIAIFYSLKKLRVSSEAISFLIPAWIFFIGSSYILFFLIGLVLLPSLFLEFISLGGIAAIFMWLSVISVVFLILFQERGKYFLLVFNNFFKIINKISGFFLKKGFIKSGLPEKFISSFYQYLDFLSKNKRKIPQILFSSFLFYFGDIFTLYFAFLIFGFHPNFIVLILGYTVSLALTVAALVPGAPGVMEASLMLVFIKLGFPADIVLFASILFRIFTYWLPLPAGIFAYWKLKKQ